MMIKWIPVALALWIATPVVALAQEDNDRAGERRVLSLAELELDQYRPRTLSAIELSKAARALVGRSYWVQEKGGLHGDLVNNIRTLGDTLLVYDTVEYAQRVMATLRELDRADGGGEVQVETVSFEYHPRFVAVHELASALKSFERKVSWGSDPRTQSLIRNLHYANAGIVIVREYPRELEEIKAVIAQVDVPEPQTTFQAYVVRGRADIEASSPELPPELTGNLERMLPQYRFEAVGFGMLQASVAPGSECKLRIEGAGSMKYELNFEAVAYDGQTSSLTVENCELNRVWTLPDSQVRREQVFSTQVTLKSDEYTVLGATGAVPVFLVLRVAPMQ